MTNNIIEILLVEDNPDDAELAISSLKKNNLANKVHLVEDGEEALAFLFAKGEYSERNIEEKPKLILLDLKLPKIDGMEVLQMIKSDEKMKTIPVVILTSSREESDIIRSYKIGVNSYIVKPVDFEKFTKSVSDLGLYWLVLNQPPE
jgi:two-component system response regulator